MARKPSITRAKPAARTEKTASGDDVHFGINLIASHLASLNEKIDTLVEATLKRNEMLGALNESYERRDERAVSALEGIETDPAIVQRLDALEQKLTARAPYAAEGAFDGLVSRVAGLEMAVKVIAQRGHITGEADLGAPANGSEPRKRGRPSNAEKAAREAGAVAQAQAQTGVVPVVEEKPATPAQVAQVVEGVKEKLAPKVENVFRNINGKFVECDPTTLEPIVEKKAYVAPRPCKGCGANLDEPNVVHSKACEVVKAAAPVNQQATPAPSPAAPAASQPVQVAPSKPPDVNDVRAVAIVYAGKHGKDKLSAILKNYGAVKLSDVAPEQLGALMAELQNGNV